MERVLKSDGGAGTKNGELLGEYDGVNLRVVSPCKFAALPCDLQAYIEFDDGSKVYVTIGSVRKSLRQKGLLMPMQLLLGNSGFNSDTVEGCASASMAVLQESCKAFGFCSPRLLEWRGTTPIPSKSKSTRDEYITDVAFGLIEHIGSSKHVFHVHVRMPARPADGSYWEPTSCEVETGGKTRRYLLGRNGWTDIT